MGCQHVKHQNTSEKSITLAPPKIPRIVHTLRQWPISICNSGVGFGSGINFSSQEKSLHSPDRGAFASVSRSLATNRLCHAPMSRLTMSSQQSSHLDTASFINSSCSLFCLSGCCHALIEIELSHIASLELEPSASSLGSTLAVP